MNLDFLLLHLLWTKINLCNLARRRRDKKLRGYINIWIVYHMHVSCRYNVIPIVYFKFMHIFILVVLVHICIYRLASSYIRTDNSKPSMYTQQLYRLSNDILKSNLSITLYIVYINNCQMSSNTQCMHKNTYKLFICVCVYVWA